MGGVGKGLENERKFKKKFKNERSWVRGGIWFSVYIIFPKITPITANLRAIGDTRIFLPRYYVNFSKGGRSLHNIFT